MDNIYKAVQLTIDSQNLALTKTPTHVYIANQYVDTNDTPLITAPFIIQKALENGTGVVDIVSSTIGSIYEVRLLCDAEVLISGYFYMPPMNANFSELELYTSYPPRTPPVVNEFWQKTENFILEKTNTLLNFVQVFNAVSSMRLSLGYLEELNTDKKSNLVSALNEIVSKYDKSPQIFNTIADLKAFADAKDKQRVIVLSRNNTDKKLGGGIFVYDAADTTTVENGGTVFIGANNGRWKRVEDDDVCVSWFAGANDGTDKSADVQKAINYANALINAKALCVDDKYWIDNTLKIDRMVDQTKGDFVIYSTGNNNGFLIKKPMTMFSSNNTVPANSAYTRNPTCEFVTFKNVDFEAETADINNFVVDDLFLRSTFDKCTFRKMRLVKAPDYLQTMKWYNCKFRQHVDFLIDCRDAYDVHFNKCELENSGAGLRFTGIARACHIDENLYEGSTSPFLAAAGFFSSSCDKNYFEANNGVDINIGINGGVSGGFTLNNNLWLLHDVSDVSFYPVKVGFANGFAMYGNTSNGNLCDNRFANSLAISEGANVARTILAVNPKMAQSLVLGDSTNYDTAKPIKTLNVAVSTATETSGLSLPKLADFKNGDKITVINNSDKPIKVYPASGERVLGVSYGQANEQTGYGKVVNYIKSDSDFWIIN